MTTYNQRLDEILERYRLFANMAYSEVEDGFRTADEFKDVALPKVLDETKQAIKQLIADEMSELLDSLESNKETLFWWTGGEYAKTTGVDMRAIEAERAKLAERLGEEVL